MTIQGLTMPVTPGATSSPISGRAGISGAASTGPSFGALMAARSSTSALDAAHPGPAPARLGAAASRALEGIEAAQGRLDGLLAAARTGRTFTAQELMSLQGEAYRYAQAVQLSAKLVEQGAQAVKHALNAQV